MADGGFAYPAINVTALAQFAHVVPPATPSWNLAVTGAGAGYRATRTGQEAL